MLTGLFEDKPIYRKFLITVSLVLFSTLVFSMVGGLLAEAVYGINILSDPGALSDLGNPVVVSAMKLLQMVSTGIGMFLVPSVMLAVLFSRSPAVYLWLDKRPGAVHLMLALVIMFTAVPLINVMLVWNQQLHLPESMDAIEAWMRSSEDQAAKLTEALLEIDTTGQLFYSLLVIAVIPAIGEELLFRGILQRLFTEITRNAHLSIFICAVVFSAIHMQFYGFLPRMMLGVLFGYLLLWTGSLWVPVFAHFVNNGAAVVFAYYAQRNELPFNQDTIGTQQDDWFLLILSTVVLAAAVAGMMRFRNNVAPTQI